jgi:hypothetical protein
MRLRRAVSGFATLGVAVLLSGGLPPAASAAPRTAATPDQAGLRVNGTVTWKQFTPYKQPGSNPGTYMGGDTKTGKFLINLFSPNGYEWKTRLSSYTVKDDVNESWKFGSCTQMVTGSASDSGKLPEAHGSLLPAGISQLWDVSPLHDLSFGIGVQLEEDVTTSYTGSACSGTSTLTNPVVFTPSCLKTAPDEFFGVLNPETDNASADCSGKVTTPLHVTYTITGTLRVDAYLFVLPRDVHSPAEWAYYLKKPHGRYPAADISVPDGTPFYAVTAGKVSLFSTPTCGSHGITLIGLDGVHYTYCHAEKALVENGVKVIPGTELGLSGHEGSRSTGPHLHFQVRVDKVDRCPQDLLWNLYDGVQPAPDAAFVKRLPVDKTYTVCSYKKED